MLRRASPAHAGPAAATGCHSGPPPGSGPSACEWWHPGDPAPLMADSGQAEGKGKVKGHHLHSNDVKYHCSLIQINITCTEQIHVYTDSQSVFPGYLCGSTNQILGTSLQFISSLGLQPVLFPYHFSLILGITCG